LTPSAVALSDEKNQGHTLVPARRDGCDQRPFFSDEIADRKSPLSQIMHSLKSYTANEANKLLSRTGQFWQHESYDHWVRDDHELARIVEYIARNPVNAGLAENAQDWPYCSLYDRYTEDGIESALLCPKIVM
jgi:hypothetical protein